MCTELVSQQSGGVGGRDGGRHAGCFVCDFSRSHVSNAVGGRQINGPVVAEDGSNGSALGGGGELGFDAVGIGAGSIEGNAGGVTDGFEDDGVEVGCFGGLVGGTPHADGVVVDVGVVVGVVDVANQSGVCHAGHEAVVDGVHESSCMGGFGGCGGHGVSVSVSRC